MNKLARKIEFKEEQKFTQWWLWLIVLDVGLIPIYGIYIQFIKGEYFGDNPMSDTGLLFFTIFIYANIALVLIMRLKTEIDNKEIRMKLVPLTKKTVQWQDVKSAQVVNYGFVGGWGIRLWTQYGTVYNIIGNKGLAIELKSGKKFLIGTQKEAELKSIVEKCL